MKYRIWDNENNRYWEDLNEAYLGRLEQLYIGTNGDLCMRTMDKIIHESVFPNRFVVEWSTGLVDRKGVEGYEGDIVKLEGYNGDIWVLSIGTYGPALTRGSGDDVEGYNNGDYYHGADFDFEEAEIIGNIHTDDIEELERSLQ